MSTPYRYRSSSTFGERTPRNDSNSATGTVSSRYTVTTTPSAAPRQSRFLPRSTSVEPSSRLPMPYSRSNFGKSSLSSSYHSDQKSPGTTSTPANRYASTEALSSSYKPPPYQSYRSSTLGGRSSSLTGSAFSLTTRASSPTRDLDKYRPPPDRSSSVVSSKDYTSSYRSPQNRPTTPSRELSASYRSLSDRSTTPSDNLGGSYRSLNERASSPTREFTRARSSTIDRGTTPTHDYNKSSLDKYKPSNHTPSYRPSYTSSCASTGSSSSGSSRGSFEYSKNSGYSSSNLELSSSRFSRVERDASTSRSTYSRRKQEKSEEDEQEELEKRFEKLYNKYVRDSDVSDSDNESSRRPSRFASRSDTDERTNGSDGESGFRSDYSGIPSRRTPAKSTVIVDEQATPTPSRKVVYQADIREGSPTTPTPQRRVVTAPREFDTSSAMMNQLLKRETNFSSASKSTEQSRSTASLNSAAIVTGSSVTQAPAERADSVTPTPDSVNNKNQKITRRSKSPVSKPKTSVAIVDTKTEHKVEGTVGTKTKSVIRRSSSPVDPALKGTVNQEDGTVKKVTLRKRSVSPVAKITDKEKTPETNANQEATPVKKLSLRRRSKSPLSKPEVVIKKADIQSEYEINEQASDNPPEITATQESGETAPKKTMSLRRRSKSPVSKPKEVVGEAKKEEVTAVAKTLLRKRSESPKPAAMVTESHPTAVKKEEVSANAENKTVRRRSMSPVVKKPAVEVKGEKSITPVTTDSTNNPSSKETSTATITSRSKSPSAPPVDVDSGTIKRTVRKRSQSPVAKEKAIPERSVTPQDKKPAEAVTPESEPRRSKTPSLPHDFSEKATGTKTEKEKTPSDNSPKPIVTLKTKAFTPPPLDLDGPGTLQKIVLRKRAQSPTTKTFEPKKPEVFIPSFTNTPNSASTPMVNKPKVLGPSVQMSVKVGEPLSTVDDTAVKKESIGKGSDRNGTVKTVPMKREEKPAVVQGSGNQGGISKSDETSENKVAEKPVDIPKIPVDQDKTDAAVSATAKSMKILVTAASPPKTVIEPEKPATFAPSNGKLSDSPRAVSQDPVGISTNESRDQRAKSQTPTTDKEGTLKKRRDRGRTLESLKESLEPLFAQRRMAEVEGQSVREVEVEEDEEELSVASGSQEAVTFSFMQNGHSLPHENGYHNGKENGSVSPVHLNVDSGQVRCRILVGPQPLNLMRPPVIMLTQPSQPNTPLIENGNPSFFQSDSDEDEEESEVESFTDDSEEFYESDFEYSVSKSVAFPSTSKDTPLRFGDQLFDIDTTITMPFLDGQPDDMRGRVEELLAKPPPMPIFSCSVTYDGQVPGYEDAVSWGSADEGSDEAEEEEEDIRSTARPDSSASGLGVYLSPASFSSDEESNESNYDGRTVGATLTLVQKAAMKGSDDDETDSSEYYDSEEYSDEDEEYWDEDEDEEEYDEDEEDESAAESESHSEHSEVESIDMSFESASEKSASPFLSSEAEESVSVELYHPETATEQETLVNGVQKSVQMSFIEPLEMSVPFEEAEGLQSIPSDEAKATVKRIKKDGQTEVLDQLIVCQTHVEPAEEMVEEDTAEELPAEQMFQSMMEEVQDNTGTKQVNIVPTYVKQSEEKVEAKSADRFAPARAPATDFAKKAVIQPTKLEKAKVATVETRVAEKPKEKEKEKITSKPSSPKVTRKAKPASDDSDGPKFGSTLSKIMAAGVIEGKTEESAPKPTKDKSSVRKSALNMSAEEAKRKEKETEEAAKKSARKYNMVGSLMEKFREPLVKDEAIVYRRSKVLQKREEERPKRTYAPIIKPVIDDTFDKQMEEIRSKMKAGTSQFQKEVSDLTRGMNTATEQAKLREQEENHKTMLSRTAGAFSKADNEKKRQRELRDAEIEKELSKASTKKEVRKDTVTGTETETPVKAEPRRTVRRLKAATGTGETPSSSTTDADILTRPMELPAVTTTGGVPYKAPPTVSPADKLATPKLPKANIIVNDDNLSILESATAVAAKKKSSALDALRNRKASVDDGLAAVARTAVPKGDGAAATKIRNALSGVNDAPSDKPTPRPQKNYGQRRKTEEIILPPKELPKKRRRLGPRTNRFIRKPGDIDVLLGWDKENTFEGLEKKFANAANDRIKSEIPNKRRKKNANTKIWISELTDIDKIYKTSELRDIIASAQG